MDADVIVVGAGVVGLATAAALAQRGRAVIVIERNSGIGQEITSRNSEVIHAGIYYPEGSLKATLCVAGREALYARCDQQKIPHRRLGKLIVATNAAEVGILEKLHARGTANGVPNLEVIGSREISRLESDVCAVAALVSPVSGIVDGGALTLSYLAEAESLGATLALCTEVVDIETLRWGYRIRARSADGDYSSLDCAALVNAAGLGCDALAARAGFDLDTCGYRLHLCKGDYFSLATVSGLRVSRLIYPVPVESGLGIHVTLDLGGRIRLGPDTEYVSAVRYDVDSSKGQAFARIARRYLPGLDANWLTPDFAGVRPKLAGPGESFRDFVIREESEAGLPGFVNLIGIESPGLTAASAIADRVAELLASV